MQAIDFLTKKFKSLEFMEFHKHLDPLPYFNKVDELFAHSDFTNKICNHIIGLEDTHELTFVYTFLKILEAGGTPCLQQSLLRHQCHYHLKNLTLSTEIQKCSLKPQKNTYYTFSSGSTGDPKPIHLSLEKALENARIHAIGFNINNNSTIAQCLPLYHSYGVVAYILTPLVTGARVNFCSKIIGLRSFKNTLIKQTIHISPSQLRFILKDKFNEAPQLEAITIGAGACSFQELEALQNKFPLSSIYVSYGLSEAGPRVSAGKYNSQCTLPNTSEAHWIGKPLEGVKCFVLINGELHQEGVGRLVISTPTAMLNIESTETFEGNLLTRDKVELLDSQIYFISREDDIIKYGGVSIYPSQIEQKVRSLESITEAIVLKKKDAFYEEIPVLFVESSEVDIATLESFLSDHLPESWIPKKIFILPLFPKNSINKIDRKKLLAMAEEPS